MGLYGSPGQQIAYAVYPANGANATGAPPLVLLHGFTASAVSFDANIDRLRSHFEVIVVELLGHGDSDAPAELAPYGPGPAVERLAGLFTELGYEKVLLCGHSLGGALALRMALDAPQLLSGVVVMNSNSAAGTPEWRARARPGMAEMAARIRAEGTAFLRKTRLYPAHSKRLDPRSRELLVQSFDRLTPEGVAGTAEGLIVDVNAYERLGDLTVPILVVLGDRDADFLVSAPGFVARLPQELVRTARIEGAGHAANIEQPEQFEQALVAFACEIGLIQPPGNGTSGTGQALIALGGLLVFGGVALLAASVFYNGGSGNDRSLAAVPPSTAATTATPTSDIVTAVAGTRIAGPGNAGVASQTSAASLNATGVATPPSLARSATASPATPTATSMPTGTPTREPAPSATPAPTSTSIPAPTTVPPTVSGPAAGISGPASAAPGDAVTFVDTSRPGADTQNRAWSASGGAQIVATSNAAAVQVQFPGAGCYTVSLSVSFRGQPSTYSASLPVAVGGALCR